MMILWIKAFHIIFMVCWFAGLFYLPRLFVYHARCKDRLSHERFVIMERKLYRGIMTPSMILTVLSGMTLLWLTPVWLNAAWIHAKLAFVIALLVYHFYCARLRVRFAEGRNEHSHVYYRWLNELPVIGLVAITILVVVKPF